MGLFFWAEVESGWIALNQVVERDRKGLRFKSGSIGRIRLKRIELLVFTGVLSQALKSC